MKLEPIALEVWLNENEKDCKYNLAETCCASISVRELLTLAGNEKEHLETLLDLKMTYGAIYGSDALRNSIASLFEGQTSENVAVTHGGVGANALTIMSLVEHGDRVISAMPNYPQLYCMPQALGADVHFWHLQEDKGWLHSIDELEKLANTKTKLICITNPNNPTGALLNDTQLRSIVDIARGCDAWVLCDESYRGIALADGADISSIVDLYEKGVSTGSLSKPYSLAGLRVGWAVGNTGFIAKGNVCRDYHIISICAINDYLATLALENRAQLLLRSSKIVDENVEHLSAWIQSQPKLSFQPPKGGTATLVRYAYDLPSVEFCLKLLKETGVFIVPGSVLGVENTFRLGCGSDPAQFRLGLELLANWLEHLKQ